MSILVVGSIALDCVKTPKGEVVDSLGGSATYFSYSASFFAPVRLVGVIGTDFPDEHVRLLKKRKIDVTGLEIMQGQTFRWHGTYIEDLNNAKTLDTRLNVFEKFCPKIPYNLADSPFVFLANIAPELQMDVLKQVKRPKLTACDTMNLWIKLKKPELSALLKKIDIFVLNDAEAKMLSGKDNAIKAGKEILKMGPKYCVVKKGEHGAILFGKDSLFALPAYPVEEVFDPTGAGDTFAGGFFGSLARSKGILTPENLKKAVLYGTVMASFNVEDFSLKRLTRLTGPDIEKRFKKMLSITQI